MSPPIPPGIDLSIVPALAPPPGVVPNFVNPVSRANTVFAANGVVTAIMLLFVFARLFAKGYYARSQFGWEDGEYLDPFPKDVLIPSTHSLLPCWNGQLPLQPYMSICSRSLDHVLRICRTRWSW